MPTKKKTPTIGISCTDKKLLRAAHQRAKERRQSFSSYVVSCIAADLAAPTMRVQRAARLQTSSIRVAPDEVEAVRLLKQFFGKEK